MFIVLTGNPGNGFVACGPFADAESARGDREDGYDWWVFPLDMGIDPSTVLEGDLGFDTAGTAIVYRGCIGVPFEFVGPFRDIEAARKWAEADELGIDCAMPLEPVPQVKLVA